MKIKVPLPPQSASRPNFNSKGKAKAHMPKRYFQWRKAFAEWLDGWMVDHGEALFKELLTLPDGRPVFTEREVTRNGKPTTARDYTPEFGGYRVMITFVVARPNGSERAFPFSPTVGDLDNLYKSVVDGFFGSSYFKDFGLDDRLINGASMLKRYTALGTNEKPHIDFEIVKL